MGFATEMVLSKVLVAAYEDYQSTHSAYFLDPHRLCFGGHVVYIEV